MAGEVVHSITAKMVFTGKPYDADWRPEQCCVAAELFVLSLREWERGYTEDEDTGELPNSYGKLSVEFGMMPKQTGPWLIERSQGWNGQRTFVCENNIPVVFMARAAVDKMYQQLVRDARGGPHGYRIVPAAVPS